MVDKRKAGRLGMDLSLLGFGCMRFPSEDGKIIDEAKAGEMIDLAMANGVNYYDTAWMYHGGNSEVFIGKALKKYPRDSYYLATKMPLEYVESVEDLEKLFEEQMRRLDVDCIDFYLFHGLKKTKMEKMIRFGALDIIKRYRSEGKIKYIGFSFHDELDSFYNILDYYDWDFCQIQLNYVDTENQQGIEGYEALRDRGIPIMIMEPVKGGALANMNESITELFTGYAPDSSVASWAHRWIASLPGITVVLSGMTTIEQVRDNLKIYSDFKPLNSEELEIIGKVRDELRKVCKVGCTDCRYCLPCPCGVKIPQVFLLYNQYYMFGDKKKLSFRMDALEGEGDGLSRCVNCGVCLSKCPQGINIPEELSKVAADMESMKG